ncbi:MAG: L,D-transpeptidase family protein, partial [Gammaproteobacteria bacterium]
MRSKASPPRRGYFFQPAVFVLACLLCLSGPVASGAAAAGESLPVTPVQRAQLDLLHGAENEGLEPSDYAPDELERLAGLAEDLVYAQFSQRLDEAFARYSRDLSQGRLDPALDPGWRLLRQPRDANDPLPAFDTAAQVEAFKETLLLPPHPQYRRLRNALQQLIDIRARDGWPLIPAGDDLHAGTRDERVIPLRNRLRISGHYTAEMQADPLYFDAGLDAAVRRFQAEHALWIDGAVGARTLEALNVPVEKRIEQVKITLERWRWLPRNPGDRYIRVNTVAAELQVIEFDKPLLSMRAIVGRAYRQTPSLQGYIDQVTFNPTWTVPHTIAVEDLLPQQRLDKTFLARNRVRIFSAQDGREVDIQEVDWANMTPRNFAYTLRQDAGPNNSLGRLRFSFKNPYDIYLHDSPDKILFRLPDRTSSSGCIRIEEPVLLAEYLLASDQQMYSEAIQAA